MLKRPTRRGSEGPDPRSAPLRLSWAPACFLRCHPALSSGRLRLALGPAFRGRGNPPCPAARFGLPRGPAALAAPDGRPPHPRPRLQERVGPHGLICFWLLLIPLKSTPPPFFGIRWRVEPVSGTGLGWLRSVRGDPATARGRTAPRSAGFAQLAPGRPRSPAVHGGSTRSALTSELL